MRPLRISAISFLNTAPLMWNFEHQPTAELTSNFEISYTVPSQCARALQEGTADIGIVPVITYTTIPGLVVIPRVTIAARGPVRSILLMPPCSSADGRKCRSSRSEPSRLTALREPLWV